MIAAAKETNSEIFRQGLIDPRFIGMGTTVVAAFLDKQRAHLVNVGDSRAYLIRPPNIIKQLTKDHSLLQELHDRLGDHEISHSKLLKHIITQWLGSRKISPYYSSIALRRGDYVLLCTDGLSGILSGTQIMDKIVSGSTLEKANRELVTAAKEMGGNDDITIVLVRVDHDNRKSKKR
jgi:protein phosphatase